MHLQGYFQTIHSVLLQTFCRSNWIWKVKGRLQFRNCLTHQYTKMSLRESSCCLLKKIQSRFYYLEPCLYPSITDFAQVINILIQGRHNQSGSFLTIKVSRKMQKVEIYVANDVSGFAFFSTDLGHIFGSNVGNEFEVMLRTNGHH